MSDTDRKRDVSTDNINKYDIEFSSAFMECHIFWARVVSSEHESLFTQNTKHTFYEIQYALDGHIGMKVGQDDRLYVAESDFVVIPPDTYHQVVDADSNGARFIMAFSLVMKDDRMNNILRHLASVCPCRETPHMRPLLSLILQKNYQHSIVRRRIMTSLLETFLLEIFEAYRLSAADAAGVEQTDITDEAAVHRVRRMENFIRSRSGIGITVTDIAEQFNMSERHVNRLFTAVTGKSPREVIQHEKLKKIEEYVAFTDLSFSEIAELCGFCDEYAMNKFFKRYNLIKLSDFRRLAKKRR